MHGLLIIVFGGLLDLVNSSRGGRLSCPLQHPSFNNRRSFFVVFANPHGGGDSFCRLLLRHPELNCSSLDVFNPSPTGAAALERARLGFDVEMQHANPGDFLEAYFRSCSRRACGVVVLRDQLPHAMLHKLFVPGCNVAKIIIERNATAEYAAMSRVRQAHSIERANTTMGVETIASRRISIPSWPQFLKKHNDWLTRVESIAPRARWHKLQLETFGSLRGGTSAEDAVLSLYRLLDVRPEDELCLFDRCISKGLRDARGYREIRELTKGYQWSGERISRALVAIRALRSAVGSPTSTVGAASRATVAVAPQGARSAERQRRRQATIGWVAAGSFSVVLIGGVCLALGIAIGQRIPLLR